MSSANPPDCRSRPGIRPLLLMFVVVFPLVLAVSCVAGVVRAAIGNDASEMTPAPSETAQTQPSASRSSTPSPTAPTNAEPGSVLAAVYHLKVIPDSAVDDAGRDFDRDEFGPAWKDVDRNGCDQRNDVLRRDLTGLRTKPGTHGCVAASGVLRSAYTGKTVQFTRGDDATQIDHVVALAEAWRTGANGWDQAKRERFANDPFNLQAVESAVNESKGDEPPMYWLPEIEQCDFVNRYISIKDLYQLGFTGDEKAWLLRQWGRDCDVTVKVYGRADYKMPKLRPTGEPKPEATASPKPKPRASESPSVYYENCAAVRRAGKAPIRRGDPGYGSHLDRDGDGVACET